MLNRLTSAGSKSVNWYSSPSFTALITREPSGNLRPASVRFSVKSIMVCNTSGRARFSSSKNSTIGLPSVGNQYGGIKIVLPVASSSRGRPIKSPGSLICPKNRITTRSPRAVKNFSRICDFPIPCLPVSMIFCDDGVAANKFSNSCAFIRTDMLTSIFLRIPLSSKCLPGTVAY